MKLVVHGLLEKRAEIVRELSLARDQLTAVETKLAAIETAIRVFDPDVSFDKLPKKRIGFATPGRKARTSRAVIDVLRAAGRRLTVREIALTLLERNQLSRTDPVLMASMINRVSGAVKRLRDQGRIQSEQDGKRGAAVFWIE
jgi:hypothetical protein